MSSKNKRDNNVPILYELSGMNPFKPKIYNPHYERHKLKVPFRMLVVGGCLYRNTPILLHNKSIKMVQNIKMGDVLLGDDGTERKVLRVVNGQDDMYKIYQTEGDDYICNSQHILVLKHFETKEIIEVTTKTYYNNQEKYEKYGGYKMDSDNVYSIQIEYKGIDEYYGFTLDKNHRFCLGDGTITHNSGISMKTNGVLWMITEAFDNTFDHIIICVKENEPLYEYFTSKLPPGSFTLYVDEIPDIKEYNKSEWKDKQLLFIFDDMMNSKNHNKQILEYFLRGRKIPKGGNSSMIYITQSFSGMGAMGKSLRQQMNLIMLKKINSMNIVDDIMSEYRLGGRTRDELIRMYNYANDKPQNFLLIDTEAKDEEIFRKNLYEFLE